MILALLWLIDLASLCVTECLKSSQEGYLVAENDSNVSKKDDQQATVSNRSHHRQSLDKKYCLQFCQVQMVAVDATVYCVACW